jgi:hypothetical protein
VDLARAIGAAAPLAVRSVRATLRRGLLAPLPAAMDHENAEDRPRDHVRGSDLNR